LFIIIINETSVAWWRFDIFILFLCSCGVQCIYSIIYISTFAMNIDSNGSDSLRQQFQLLQEQHKKKLLLRKQKLSTQTEVTAEQKPEYLNGGNSHGSIEDLDNLELQVRLQPACGDLLFSLISEVLEPSIHHFIVIIQSSENINIYQIQ
jgi:hypothetical protein